MRIRYADLMELVRQDLNSLLTLSNQEIEELAQEAARRVGSKENLQARKMKRERAEARVATIDKIVTKLYTDNAAGKLDDDRLSRMVGALERGIRWAENHAGGIECPQPRPADGGPLHAIL